MHERLIYSETMKKLNLPYVKMPAEFVTLLKTNLATVTSPSMVFDVIRPNQALCHILEKAFKEFDDGRGVEKILTALGWSNFRDRMASLFVYKSIHGEYPSKTDMELVDDIKLIEAFYSEHGIHGYSRLFLFGFYIKLANIQLQEQGALDEEIKIPIEVGEVLKLSQGRSDRVDWLILIITHLIAYLGEKTLINYLLSGKKMKDIYSLLTPDARKEMHSNLLAYSASIDDPDFILYEKV